MKTNILIFTAFVCASCGPIKVDHKIDQKVDGEVRVVLDLKQIEKYFRLVCEEEHPNDLPMQDKCVAYKVNDFIEALKLPASDQYTPPDKNLADSYVPPKCDLPTLPTATPTPEVTPTTVPTPEVTPTPTPSPTGVL